MGVEEKKGDLLFNMSEDEFINLLNTIKELDRTTGVRTNVDELIENVPFMWAIYQGQTNKEPDCLHPWLQAYVNVDGEITPCDALNSNEGISMGNVCDGKFADVWNSDKYIGLRKIAREKKLPFKSCSRCPSKGLKWFVEKYKFLKL